MEYNGDIVGHRVSEDGSIFIPNASALSVYNDSIRMTYESDEPRARNEDCSKLPTTPARVSDLGSRPMCLTSKGKEKASSVLQVEESPPSQPKKPVTGSTSPPKKGKQAWVVKAINSLRIKPFCCEIEEVVSSDEGRKGPKSYG